MAASWPRLLLALVLPGGLAFSNVLGFDLVWDDTHLLHNSVLGGSSLATILGSDFWLEGERSGYYRPLITLTYLGEALAFGPAAWGHHAMSVLYHLAASLALVWVGMGLVRDRLAAWLAGLVFALHPIHTESVAFVSGRTDVIATLFVLLALGCHAEARTGGRPAWTLGALLAFAAALLSKEVAVVFPGLLLAFELALAPRTSAPGPRGAALRRLLPFLLVLGGYLALRKAVLGTVVGLPLQAEAAADRTLAGLEVLGRYLLLLVLPYPPNPDYVLEPPAWPPWAALAGLAAILALGAAALATWRRSRIPAFLLAWFLLALLPALPLLPARAPEMAERFLYLPSVAFALLVGWGVRALLAGESAPRWASRAAGVAMGLLLLAAGALTVHRNEDWRNAETLFERMAEVSPRSWRAAVNLGYAHLHRGRLARAGSEFGRALELRPELPAALVGLAVVESQGGRHARAIRLGERARSLEPRNEIWDLQLGAIHGNAGDHATAASRFAEAARKNPRRADAKYQLGLALHRSGRVAEAREALREADELSRRARLKRAGWQEVAERVRAVVTPGGSP